MRRICGSFSCWTAVLFTFRDNSCSTAGNNDWLAKLMKRRAERNAPEPSEMEKDIAEGTNKASATKAAKKVARLLNTRKVNGNNVQSWQQ